MARQTRQERRARRAQAVDGAGAPPRQRVSRPVAQASPEPAQPRALPGSGPRRFIGESWAELKKVDWPNQQQVIAGTAVVLVACIIVGFYLWGLDQVFKRIVQHVLLR